MIDYELEDYEEYLDEFDDPADYYEEYLLELSYNIEDRKIIDLNKFFTFSLEQAYELKNYVVKNNLLIPEELLR